MRAWANGRGRILILAVGIWLGAPLAASPDMTLPDLTGTPRHLSQYIGKGKWVVLNIWGPKCPPCVEEMPELQLFHDAHHEKDAIVVGMALDFPSFGPARAEEVKAFVDDYLITFPVLLGSGALASELGAGRLRGTPTTLVYNRQGELVAQQLGQVTGALIENFIRQYEQENRP